MRRLVACLFVVGCASANQDQLAGGDAGGADAPLDASAIDVPMADACTPSAERCNDVDDDCDGHADEGFSLKGMPCTLGVGACAATGHYACSADGAMTVCDATPGAPSMETCDSVDNDCDGMTDEGLGLGQACDGADTDACNEGLLVCDGAGGVTCSDTTGNNVELCNGIDDDCLNGADDTFPIGQACTVGLGACARTGSLVCDAAQTGTVCNATAGAPMAEVCGNGVDEDCNGFDVACPANDFPAGAIDISAGGTFTADLTAAHDDNWAPTTPALDCGNMGGRDVFYQFTLPAEEVVYFDTFGSNFDSVIRVFDGACTSIGATRACADDACSTTRSQGAVDLAAGTYCLVVDQFSNTTAAGAATLVFERGGRPGTQIAAASGSVTGTTTGAVPRSTGGCESNSAQAPDAGYFFLTCPAHTYTVGANTFTGTAYDSVLYLRSGAATSGDVVCSDDETGCGSGGLQSRFAGQVVSGANLQWLIVDGFGTNGHGAFKLTYTIL